MTATATRHWEIIIGVLVGIAAAVHGVVSRPHFDEWWAYGVFFLAATVCQALFALALVTNALDPAHAGAAFDRLWRPRLYWAGIVGNALIAGLYVVTRTVSVPLGPQAGEVEAWAALGTASFVLEIAAVGALVAIVSRGRTPAHGTP